MTLGQGLLTAHVDHRARQVPFLQSIHQIRIDHRHTAPGVDEQPGRLELLEQRSVVDIVGFHGVRQQIDHVIDFTDQPRQIRQ
ncbi:hypothetical protein D3C86_1348790 [compost metagenome]